MLAWSLIIFPLFSFQNDRSFAMNWCTLNGWLCLLKTCILDCLTLNPPETPTVRASILDLYCGVFADSINTRLSLWTVQYLGNFALILVASRGGSLSFECYNRNIHNKSGNYKEKSAQRFAKKHNYMYPRDRYNSANPYSKLESFIATPYWFLASKVLCSENYSTAPKLGTYLL